MLPDKKVMCHHTGFKMQCFKGVTEHNCSKWLHISGLNPNTGQPIDQFGCADSFLPLIMIENTQMQRQTGAAVESFRNEMLKLNGIPGQLTLEKHQ